MIEMKSATIAICGILFAWGGYSFLIARRFIMPFILAIAVIIATGVWWCGLMVLPSMGTLTLGYKNFGQGNFARAIWLGLQALIIAAGLTLTHHLIWPVYAVYALIAAILAGILNNRLPQIWGDIIFGAWLGAIVLLVV